MYNSKWLPEPLKFFHCIINILDNNMISNQHLSHVLFHLFSISLFSLASFVKHFDGEIVLAPRSNLRCNYHMVSELVGVATNLVRFICFLGNISSLCECFSLQIFTTTSWIRKMFLSFPHSTILNGIQRCVNISRDNVSMICPLVLWENQSPIKRNMIGLMTMTEPMELCVSLYPLPCAISLFMLSTYSSFVEI